jgi:peptidoglycan hydrolase-like protein with peptidoglycan-binding domain
MLDSKPVNSANEPKPSLAAKPVEQRAADPVGNLLKAPAPPASPATTGAVARPPAAIPNATRTDPLGDLITNTRRVAAVQRALTEYGYGQLKPTGNVGSDTAAAIQRFERERKLPVTGQVSDRMVRELATVTGRAID